MNVISLASAQAVPRHCGRQVMATWASNSWSVQEGRLPLNCILGPEWGCNTPVLFFNYWAHGGAGPQRDPIRTGAGPQQYCPTEGWSPPEGTGARVGAGCLAARGVDPSPGLDLAQLFSTHSKHRIWKRVG